MDLRQPSPWITLPPQGSTYRRGKSVQTNGAGSADVIAVNLLKGSGIGKGDLARSLLGAQTFGDDNTWAIEFRRSSSKLIAEAGQEDFALALFSDEDPVDHRELSVSLARQPSSDTLLERTAAMGRPAL